MLSLAKAQLKFGEDDIFFENDIFFKEKIMYQLPNHPQPIRKVLDDSVKLFATSFRQIAPLSLVLALFSTFLFVQPVTFHTLVFFLLRGLLLIWWHAAIAYRIGAIMYGHNSNLGLTLALAAKKTFPLCVVFILFVLVVVAPFSGLVVLFISLGNYLPFSMVVIIFAVIILVFLSFIFFQSFVILIPLIVLDNNPILTAFMHSQVMVWRNWWRAAITSSVSIILTIGMSEWIGIGTAVLVTKVGFENSWTLILLFLTLFITLFLPLSYSLIMVQYHDLKLRTVPGNIPD